MDWHGRIDSMNRLFGAMWSVPPGLLEAPDHAAALDFITTQVVETDLFCDRLTATMENRATSDLLHHLDAQIIGRLSGFQDITKRIQAETSLWDSRDQLEKRVQARTFDLNWSVGGGRGARNQQPSGFLNSNLGSLPRYVANLLTLLAEYEQTEINLPVPALHVSKQVRQEVDIDFLREDVLSLLAESVDGLKRVTRIVQDLKNFAHVDEAERQFANLEEGLENTLRVVWNELKYKADAVKEHAGIPPIACLHRS
jgi:C4-dicarboxylate-specific signal transduction histidine kinase